MLENIDIFLHLFDRHIDILFTHWRFINQFECAFTLTSIMRSGRYDDQKHSPGVGLDVLKVCYVIWIYHSLHFLSLICFSFMLLWTLFSVYNYICCGRIEMLFGYWLHYRTHNPVLDSIHRLCRCRNVPVITWRNGYIKTDVSVPYAACWHRVYWNMARRTSCTGHGSFIHKAKFHMRPARLLSRNTSFMAIFC